ncbi:hypothetical protein BGZ73_005053 [Actinomortierella ambigua]|nr:hypothetical protein BGZ73_005053 [Actinomortierella ambigua]
MVFGVSDIQTIVQLGDFKAAVSLVAGAVSLAYFISTVVRRYSFDMEVPTVALKNVGLDLTREVLRHRELNGRQARDEVTGMVAFARSMIKSKRAKDLMAIQHIIRRMITPHFGIYMPLTSIAASEEIAAQPHIIKMFSQCSDEFRNVLALGNKAKNVWRVFLNRFVYTLMSPMPKRIKMMTAAITPMILRRRKEEEEAEQGEAYARPGRYAPDDARHFDEYGFVDMEDMCGHILLVILAATHTTADMSANLLYYLAHHKARGLPAAGRTDPKAFKKMAHFDSFVREALRHRAVLVDMMCVASQEVTLSNGVCIPKGRTVAIDVRSTHKVEALQGPDPMEFRPWWFVGKGKSAAIVSADHLAFGMGSRACPGRFLAIETLKAFLCIMVTRFSKFEIEDPSKAATVLHSRMGDPLATGLYLTTRQ